MEFLFSPNFGDLSLYQALEAHFKSTISREKPECRLLQILKLRY